MTRSKKHSHHPQPAATNGVSTTPERIYIRVAVENGKFVINAPRRYALIFAVSVPRDGAVSLRHISQWSDSAGPGLHAGWS